MKFPSGDLNFDPYPPHRISTNTCRLTIASKMCDSMDFFFFKVTLIMQAIN